MGDTEREVWLADRKKSIGGSDAAAIIGFNKYSTPYTVWADKTGRLPDKEDNEAMRQGRDLEDYVAKRFCEETGKRVKRHNNIIRNPAYPFAHATIDRKVIGENAGLECKTTSVLNLKKFKNGEYPDNYYVQCVHYMAVTGAERWYLAVLVFGQVFYHYVIERDEDEIESLMQAEGEFWNNYVKPDVPPPADGKQPTTRAIDSIFCNEEENIVNLYKLNKDFEAAAELSEQIKLMTELKDKHIQNIKNAMENSTVGESKDYTATWRSRSRRSIDTESLIRDYPDIDLTDYTNVTHSRVFKIKKLQVGGIRNGR